MITEYREYVNPKKVYIPLTDFEYKMANVAVEEGDRVLVGQKVADKFKGKEKRRIVSTISGTVVGFEEKYDRFGKIVDHIVIENDNLNEHVEVPTYNEQVTSMQIRNRLLEFGIDRVAFDGLYTPIDYTQKINHVVVSAVYINEPFVSTDYDFVEKNGEAISTGLQLLGKAAGNATLTVLVDRFMPKPALDELGKAIVDKNINLITVDAMKHKDWDYKFIQKLIGKECNINLLKDGVIFTNVHASKMVYEAVVLGKAPTSKEIALTGDGLKVNVLFNVKIGTLLPQLIEDLEGYNEVERLNVHIGSYLTGVQVPTDDFAIVENIDSIRISEYRKVEEDICIKCGDCNDACPAGILPQNIMDAELRNVNQRIVDLDTHLCTECGLCTYVCPSKINVLEWVRRAKRRVG